MPKQTKRRFRDPEQPDELFGHPCKVKVSSDGKIIEVTFNEIKVSEVPFKESDLPLAYEKSTFPYNNKNWFLYSVDPSDATLLIGTEPHYITYKVIAWVVA